MQTKINRQRASLAASSSATQPQNDPPPYTPFEAFPELPANPTYSTAEPTAPPAPNTTTHYHPASFPGYTMVRMSTGEQSALLPRIRRRLVRRRGRCRCCQMCSWACALIVGVLLGVVFGTAMYVKQQQWPALDWRCTGQATHMNYTSPVALPLDIESTGGVSVTDVYLVSRNSTSGSFVISVDVESSRSHQVDVRGEETDGAFRVAVHGARARWPFDCARVRVTVGVPETHARPVVRARLNGGNLFALDLGALRALGDVHFESRNGKMQLRDIVAAKVVARTANGAVSAKAVGVGELEVVTSNAPIYLTAIECASGIVATTANADVYLRDVSARAAISVRTSNASVRVVRVDAREVVARTANGRVAGDIVFDRRLDLVTTNAPIDVVGTGAGDVRAVTSNGNARVKLMGMGPSEFEVMTSNGRAVVEAQDPELLHVVGSVGRKSGVYRGAGEAHIRVATSNANTSLMFGV